MAELRQEGALGFTDDGRPVHSAGMLRKALQYQRLCGGVLSLHEEDPTLSRGGAMHEGAVSAALGIARDPDASPSRRWSRATPRSPATRTRACTSSTSPAPRRSTPSPRPRRTAGGSAPRSARTTCCSPSRTCAGLDTRMKMYPPLATEADRLALIEGLRAGTIDCVATDHAPHARDEKEVPFEQAPMGSTGLETAFAALHTGLVLPGIVDLALLVERMTAGAALYELPTPSIAVGEPANLTLVDLDAVWVAGEHGWESRSENCCFAGRRLQGRVLLTLAAGAIAHRDRALAMVGAR